MSKIHDLIGQRFGRLVVTALDEVVHCKARWKCICDCGNETVTFGHNLISGNTSSCGCYKKESTHKRCFVDITGKRYGNLVVLRCTNETSHNDLLWECQCDCGNRIITASLGPKGRISCGCVLRNKFKYGAGNPNWKGGISYEPYCPRFNNDLKQRVREFFNNECIICGRNKHDNKKNLSVHHVEYNKQACCDGKPAHFAALCSKCHAKTNSNRARWEYILHIIIDEIYYSRSYYTIEEYRSI